MKLKSVWMAAALAIVLAVPAVAGEKGEYHCKAEAQACLNEMVGRLKGRGWVGIEMDETQAGTFKVTRVVPGGPAEAGGLKAGDVLLAVNGIAFGKDNEKLMAKTRESWVPGAKAEYSVQRGSEQTVVTVKLGQFPSDVLAQMIGMHMLEHHAKTSEVAKK